MDIDIHLTVTTAAQFAVVGLVSIYALYVYYCAIMNIWRVYRLGKLTLLGKVFGIPTLAIGLAIDVFVNILVATVVFLDLPREWTLSQRLSRYISKDTGYRRAIARWIEPVLDPLDPRGDHI
jgi:hypothetical protein